MVTHSKWQTLKIELRKEARSLFCLMGDVVLIEPIKESDSELTLSRRSCHLKLSFVSELNAVRWRTANEFGIEWLSEPIPRLAITLVNRLTSHS
jgi:hypothetical protein